LICYLAIAANDSHQNRRALNRHIICARPIR